MGIENTLLPDLSFQFEKSYTETSLHATASKAKLSRKVLELSLGEFPKEWPFMDKVLVLLFPFFEEDVRGFHEDKGPSMNDLFKENQIETIDRTLIFRLEEFLDDEISNFKSIEQDTALISQIHTFIKLNKNVVLRDITREFNIHHLNIKGVLNGLIKDGSIYKHDYGDKIVYSKNPIHENTQKQILETKTSNSDSAPGTLKDIETILHKVLYYHIKKYVSVTIIDLANSFSIKLTDVESILNQMVKSGFINRIDSENKVYYSANNTAFETSASQDKPQKPLAEDGSDLNEPELKGYLNKKPLSALPDHNYNAEEDERLSDDVRTTLHNEADFELDEYMSDDEPD
jgi:hypothetical protein